MGDEFYDADVMGTSKSVNDVLSYCSCQEQYLGVAVLSNSIDLYIFVRHIPSVGKSTTRRNRIKPGRMELGGREKS
jgi:hypothetical protein